MSDTVLKEEERLSLAFRALYKSYGYLPYKMSKFEEYDLYVQNKEFLAGDGVITFNDTDGRLMALKPDVTLSILKNDVDGGEKRKVYYDENVYRISARTKQFKEIRQVGLECLGEIDVYDVYETVCLAAESLASVSDDFLLNLSHLGILYAVLQELGGGEKFAREALQCVANKNAHEAAALCETYGVDEQGAQNLALLLSAHGETQTVLRKIQPLCTGGGAKGYAELCTLCKLLSTSKYADKIRLDFSVDGDMNYYDDILFKGFVQGVGEGVLSGGRYDKLLSRMGRKSGGIGFAVYLDALEGFGRRNSSTDVDVLVLYDEKTDKQSLIKQAEAMRKEGKSVRVQRHESGLRAKEIVDLTGGGV